MRPSDLLVFDGQSLNLYPQAGTVFPTTVADTLDRPWANVAITGASWTTLAASARSRFYGLGGDTLVMTGGSSDILQTHDNDSAAVALADMESYADNARAVGYSKIVASTVTPSVLLDADGETQRVALNTGIRASTHWDAVADLAAAPELDDCNDATYYSDGTHPTAAGVVVIAGLVVDAITAS